jgi:proteic killer suppression protein
VQVTFRTRQLEACYTDAKKARREWDEKVARRYVERVNILKHARSVDDLHKTLVLRFHQMQGDKSGRYSITLIGRLRMEVSFQDEELTIVRVEEVSQHYGD